METEMESRIADPFSWDGHEAETLLVCESGSGRAKELVADWSREPPGNTGHRNCKNGVAGRRLENSNSTEKANNPGRRSGKDNWNTAKYVWGLCESGVQRRKVHG